MDSKSAKMLDALSTVLRTRFEVLQDPEIVTASSLMYRPDAFFITPDGTLFVVEVKIREVKIDDIRVLVDFRSDLQKVIGNGSIEILICSPFPASEVLKEYITTFSSLKSPVQFALFTEEMGGRILSLDKKSTEFKKESEKLLSEILQGK